MRNIEDFEGVLGTKLVRYLSIAYILTQGLAKIKVGLDSLYVCTC